MSYNSDHAARIKDLKTLGSQLKDTLMSDNAGAHNSIYRGKDLGTFSEAHSAAIRAGSFMDIYIGDYWAFSNIPYTYLDENDEEQSSTYNGAIRVADLDYYLRAGDAETTAHHAVVVPDRPMFSAQMNDTNTTEGGYVGSKMRTVYLRRAEAIFKACFGENHVLKHRERLSNAVQDGKALGLIFCDSLVDLMDECMVYGLYQLDSAQNGRCLTYKQLNLFRYRADLIHNRAAYWLRNITSNTDFAIVDASGVSLYVHSAYSPGYGVRPYALIY